MKSLTLIAVALTFAIGLVASSVAAEEMTLTGKIMCAKCALKKADAKECQDVLVVTDAKGEAKEYYITKNAVLEKFGHTCKGEQSAVVTGSVAEKDGKTWVTPTKMEKKG